MPMPAPTPMERPSAAAARLRRACTNCTVGKAKCSPFSTDECERCHRLGKPCRYDTVAATRKRPQSNLRILALERKVEELATRPVVNHTAGIPISSTSSVWPNGVNSLSNPGTASSTPSSTLSSTTNSTDGVAGDIIDRGLITQQRAQALLDRFRATAAQQFPFVVIPADYSLESIRSQNRFLFLAIIATMVFDDTNLQHQLGDELRQQVLQRMLLGNEKTLDLLQALLVYTAWYCHFVRPGDHQELLLSQLCVTLAHDLGLDQGKKRQLKSSSNLDSAFSLANAQMRAYLGAYCISCLIATVQRKRTALAHTDYIDRCYQSLAERKEYKTDELIPTFVRSQRLCRQISDTFCYDSPANGEIRGEYLVTLTVDAFIRDLDRLQAEVPIDFQKSIHLKMEFHAIMVTINEAAFHSEFWAATNGSTPAPASSYSITRSKMLWRSLNSCQDLISTFLTYQNQDLFDLTVFVCPRLLYAFITLAKLVALHSENKNAAESQPAALGPQGYPWSMVDFAKEANYQPLAEQVLDKFTSIATDFVGPEGRRDSMANAAAGMRMMIEGYKRQISEAQERSQRTEMAVVTGHMAQTRPEAGDAAFTSDQASDSDGIFDADFTFESPENSYWNDILDSFTIVPYL